MDLLLDANPMGIMGWVNPGQLEAHNHNTQFKI